MAYSVLRFHFQKKENFQCERVLTATSGKLKVFSLPMSIQTDLTHNFRCAVSYSYRSLNFERLERHLVDNFLLIFAQWNKPTNAKTIKFN
jgi:hypothetical protein